MDAQHHLRTPCVKIMCPVYPRTGVIGLRWMLPKHGDATLKREGVRSPWTRSESARVAGSANALGWVNLRSA